MGVNADALKAACSHYQHILRREHEGPAGPLIDTLNRGLERLLAGKALGADEKELLEKALMTYIGGLKRSEAQDLLRDDDAELLSAMERSREGLEQWPVLSPLSVAADIPVPEAPRTSVEIDR